MKYIYKLKIVLIIPMVLIEIFLLGSGWLLALFNKPAGNNLVSWSIRNLPNKEWYYY